MNTLRKIARSAIALIVLAATSDAVIFQRENIAALLRKGIASIPGRFLEPTIALLSGLALLGLFIICRQLAYSVAAFARFLWVTPEQLRDAQLEHKDRIALENDLRANRIQVITTLVQSLGGIAVLIGIYFAWANLKTTQEAQKDTQKNQADALKITQEGQITDLFTKAIDQLGSPNLELRLGGIYALERIARDSEKDHWPIMEVLTTYVREHAPIKETEDKKSGSAGAKPNSNKPNPPAPVAAPSPDIQAIITVIGRRDRTFEKDKREYLNLARTNLSDANLNVADLSGANLSGADLSGAHLSLANLSDAYLSGAYLSGAYLIRAHLSDANLSGAYLSGANLSGAYLSGAHLSFANLSDANLSGAHLSGADLSGADLSGAHLSGAYLSGANLSGANLSGAILTQEQIDSAHGDKETELPLGIVMPKSWKQSP